MRRSTASAGAEQTKIAGVHLDGNARRARQHVVIQLGRQFFEGRLAAARAALGVHVVVAFKPAFDQFRDQLRRMLQVGVHEDGAVAARVVDGGRQRDLLAEVARKAQVAHAGVLRRQGAHNFKRGIGAAVVHEKQLEVAVPHAADDAAEALVQRPQVLLLVVKRHRHGKQRPSSPSLLGHAIAPFAPRAVFKI